MNVDKEKLFLRLAQLEFEMQQEEDEEKNYLANISKMEEGLFQEISNIRDDLSKFQKSRRMQDLEGVTDKILQMKKELSEMRDMRNNAILEGTNLRMAQISEHKSLQLVLADEGVDIYPSNFKEQFAEIKELLSNSKLKEYSSELLMQESANRCLTSCAQCITNACLTCTACAQCITNACLTCTARALSHHCAANDAISHV